MPGTLGIEQKQRAEHEQQRAGLELCPNGVVGHVAAGAVSPPTEFKSKDRQDVLAQHEVQASAQVLPVVARLTKHLAKCPVNQIRGRQQPEQRTHVGLQRCGV